MRSLNSAGHGRAVALNLVLVEPEIPQNTGNIARSCAATGARLHLVHPLGFKINDTKLKRAGMDYWYQVEIIHHENLEAFLTYSGNARLWFSSTKAAQAHSQVAYQDEDFILFGKEGAGLPEDLLEKNLQHLIRIPMLPDRRSLNLSSAAAVVLFEALRQMDFPDLQHWGPKRDGGRFS